MSDNKKSQWAVLPNGFIPSSGHVDRLPFGVYTCELSMAGWYVAPSKITSDTIYALGDTTHEDVIHEIDKFVSSREAYKKYGLIYKRGILLEGDPGTGKTVLMANIAKTLVDKKCYVLLAGTNVSAMSNGIEVIKTVHPDDLLVVAIEDIDHICEYGGEEALLEAMDGATQADNIVFIATTNKIKDLPDRIKNRPSRFDKVVRIGKPNKQVRANYLSSLEGDMPSDIMQAMVEHTDGLVIAQIKEVFILVRVFGASPKDAAERVRRVR